MPITDREALRTRARAFVDSDAFDVHYQKMHFPAWFWYVGNLIRCLTIVAIPSSIGNLFRSRQQAFDSPDLKEAYRRLPESGHVVQAMILVSNSALGGNPTACGPALVVAALSGTDHGDAAAQQIWHQIFKRVHMGEGTRAIDAEVETMLNDERYQAFRKRPLPTEFTGGPHVHLLDIKIDNELLRDPNMVGPPEICLLVDPSPQGLILQIPQSADPNGDGGW